MTSKDEIRALVNNAKIVVRILVQPQALFVNGESLIAPIVGETTTPIYGTLPVIHVEGWEDTVKIIVSCVTHNPPYKCHPFILVDRPNKCRYGVYTDYLPKGKSKFAVMSGVGIKILTEECFAQSLRIRRYLDANPFERDCNPLPVEEWSKLRLCFHGYVKTPSSLLFDIPLRPVISNLITLAIIDRYGSLKPVSPIVVRSYLTHEKSSETDSSSVAASSASGSAVQWETQRKSLEQELPSSAAADNSSVAISSSDQVFTTKTSIDMTLKYSKADNLFLYYHKKGKDLSDSDSD